jgi:hypothetical protein
MFGAPKSKGWYCLPCDTSNNSKEEKCKNCGKTRDGKIFESKKVIKKIDTGGESLTSEEIRKLHSGE